ncbi:MAG: AsmA family protein [Gammaproteobacteria bacterium]|nr:AsmA family protein [Gammaproteobacteria bacterium]
MLRWIALLFAATVLALAVAAAYLGSADLGRHKDRLTPLASKALGRELRIDGRLSLHLGRTVTLRAADVSIANAEWASEPYLVRAAGVEAEVDFWSLIRGPARIKSLALQGAVIRLQEDDDGHRNWARPSTEAGQENNARHARGALPRIAVFKASDVRILLAAPNLTGVSEVVVDSVDYAVDGDLITADASGEINGYPMALASRILPAEDPSNAGALRIDADVRMGDVFLTAGIRLDDANTLAVSSAELELGGPDIDYVFRILKLPKITSGPLAIRASLAPDPQRSGFDAEGQLGEYHFSANGWLEDLRGAGGFDMSVRLAGPSLAALGRPLNIETLPDLPFDVETELRSRTAGIEIDNTRFRVGEEQARGRGTIIWLPRGGQELDVRADYRDMSSTLLVKIPASWPAGQLGFDLGVESEDAVDPARYLGLDHLDGQPFVLSANGTYGSRTISLHQASLGVGKQKLKLTGRAELVDDDPDIDVRFDAEGIDLSAWMAGSDVLDAGLRTVAGTGRLKLSQGRLEADELALRSNDVSLGGSMRLPLAEHGKTGNFALHLTAPTLNRIVPGLAGGALDGQPVDLRADGSWEPGEWQLGELLWRIPERGDMRGSISFTESETRSMRVRLTSESLDLRPAKNAAPASPDEPAADRVIPAQKITLPRSDDLAVDLKLDIDSLHSPVTAGASVVLEARLSDNQLIVDRLETNGKRGQISASLIVEENPAAALEARLELTGRGLYIAAPNEPAAALTARPRYDLRTTLQAQGADMRELAQTLNGRLLIQAEAGTITRRGGVLVTLVMDDFLSRTLETINPLIKDRDEVQLTCFVVFADIQNGKVQGAPLVALQTTEVNLLTRGEIDLGSESLKLDIITRPRRGFGISLGDIINPFTRVGGTLATPRLVADPGSAVFETGANILTGGGWVVARKFRDRFFAGNPCAKALKASEKANEQR